MRNQGSVCNNPLMELSKNYKNEDGVNLRWTQQATDLNLSAIDVNSLADDSTKVMNMSSQKSRNHYKQITNEN